MFEHGLSFSNFFKLQIKRPERPVSFLPAFSKILQRVMYNGLLRFLNNHNILSDNQYGFCKHHSTAYALACLYDKISSVIENKEYSVHNILTSN